MNVVVNGIPREVPDASSVAAVVAALAGPATGAAVAVNDTVVPRGRWAGTPLVEGDRVEVLVAVQGG